MAYQKEPNVELLPSCYRSMEKHHISKEDVLMTLFYAQKEVRNDSVYHQYDYKKERNFGTYLVRIYCYWHNTDKRWIVTTCWRKKI